MKRILFFIFCAISFWGCAKKSDTPKPALDTTATTPVVPVKPPVFVLPTSLTGKWVFSSDTLESYNNHALIIFNVNQIPKGSFIQFNNDSTATGHIAPYPTYSTATNYKFSYTLVKNQVNLDTMKGYFTITNYVHDTLTVRHLVSGSIATNDDILQVYCLVKQPE